MLNSIVLSVLYAECRNAEQHYAECQYNDSCSCANRTVHIEHQCRKTTVLSCHRCLMMTGVEKMNSI
jgi:hypothetical protein